jgi:hypothetical protein
VTRTDESGDNLCIQHREIAVVSDDENAQYRAGRQASNDVALRLVVTALVKVVARMGDDVEEALDIVRNLARAEVAGIFGGPGIDPDFMRGLKDGALHDIDAIVRPKADATRN